MISLIVLAIEFIAMNMHLTLSGVGVSDGTATIAIIVFSIAFCYELQNSRVLSAFFQPLFFGYLWRLFVLYFDVYGKSIYTLPNSGADSLSFYRWARHFAETGETSAGLFTSVMGTVIRWIGDNILYLQFIVMLFSIAAIIAMTYGLLELGVSGEVINTAVLIVGLLPNFAILSCVFLRESVVVMFLSISLLFFVLWYKRKRELFFILAFISIFFAAGFHSGAAGAALGYILVRFFYDKTSGRFRLRASNIIIAAFFVVIFTYLYTNYSEVLFGKMQNLQDVSDIANINEAGGSSYARYVGNSNTLGNMAIYTVPRIVYFLFSPFPWQWRGMSDIIAFAFSSMFYMISVYNAIKVISSRGEEHSIVILLLLLLIGIVFVFAWGTSNTGTATRHREKMVTIFATLWAVSKNQEIKETYKYRFRER